MHSFVPLKNQAKDNSVVRSFESSRRISKIFRQLLLVSMENTTVL